MASVNKVILIGNTGSDPQSRTMPNGEAAVNFSLATTDSWRDKSSGEKREATEWHRLVAYRKTAEIIGQYVKKGTPLYIEGRLRTRKWQDKDGQERQVTEIEVLEFQMLGSRRSGDSDGAGGGRPSGAERGAGGGVGNASPAPKSKAPGSFDDPDEDIPFGSNAMAYDTTFNKAFGRVRRSV